MINAPEFISLIRLYESLTMEDIKASYIKGSVISTAMKLTGYGSKRTCTLCKVTKFDCKLCVYKKQLGCQIGSFENSYFAIGESRSGVELLNAFKKRAVVLRDYAKKLKISID